ncbi:MAG: GPR endopeptidase, partial [Clostridia bacterium]|nr:GPR endopeptidase [Clostridia bacterium]
ITPDALGARCADKINATRHVMAEYDVFKELGCSDVSVIKPGVLSETGIESSDMIKGVVSIVSPDVLIVIDAMSARCVDRLASTVQLSDTGISPGKGIGNRRPAVDRESVGCAVVSIGVPTVVDSSTLICDALQRAGIEEISAELEAILENGKSFFVSLNDSDMIIERLSDVISKALNEAFGTAEL